MNGKIYVNLRDKKHKQRTKEKTLRHNKIKEYKQSKRQRKVQKNEYKKGKVYGGKID